MGDRLLRRLVGHEPQRDRARLPGLAAPRATRVETAIPVERPALGRLAGVETLLRLPGQLLLEVAHRPAVAGGVLGMAPAADDVA